MHLLFNKLKQHIDGEVLLDKLSRMLYASDASPYQQLPLAVVRPRHAQDCVQIVRFAAEYEIPIIVRAAGTSLAGQCVGEGMIVDISRHMHRIVVIDENHGYAKVEPGVVHKQLNEVLQALGVMFAPDPSTSAYCTIGGMAGNNAWGIHSLRYAASRENICSVEAILSDGALVVFGPLDAQALQRKLALNNREGEIYRTVVDICHTQQCLIGSRFSQPDGIVRNSGYALDVLIAGQPWQQHGPLFNLAPLLCGSEGTLAIMTAIEVKLVSLPKQRFLLCAHFHSLQTALQSVAEVLTYQPAALELVDAHILDRSKQARQQQANRFWLQGNPAAVLLIEFHEDAKRGINVSEQAIEALRVKLSAYAISSVSGANIERVWALRKAGLGLLMGQHSALKAVTGIEDAAVKVVDLAAYVTEVKTILSRYGCACVVYGPVGRGVLHLRPKLNLNLPSEQQKYLHILEQVSDLVTRYQGAISAKHGDGRLRGYYLERALGSEVVALLQQVKNAFDPLQIFNPHKILNTAAPDIDLRFSDFAIAAEFTSFFDWSADSDLKIASQKCNGAGVCLQASSVGSMCPSYQVTQEEQHSTRGRANVFRQVLATSDVRLAMCDATVKQALDLCLACKACKTECPANVDMAQLKAEFLQHYNNRHGVPLRAKLINHLDRFNHYASRVPRFSNWILAQPWLKKMLGLHRQCQLPQLAERTFSQWWQIHQPVHTDNSLTEVVLILDAYSEYYEPDIAIAAVLVLQRLNVSVLVTPCMSLGRAQISQGLLQDAQQRLVAAINYLHPYALAGKAILSLEPSELLTLRDEAPLLLKSEQLKIQLATIADQTFLFDEFVSQHAALIKREMFVLPHQAKRFLLHGHCHQKALLGMQCTQNVLSLIPNATVEIIASGCCGMAGAFGYEQEHYLVSQQIAELVLFPALRNRADDTLVVATGCSCRQQIFSGLACLAYHPAQVLASALGCFLPE